MNNEIETIKDKILKSLERLDKEQENINEEVARSNAVSQLANTYIKSCNLVIRFEEQKNKMSKQAKGYINEK